MISLSDPLDPQADSSQLGSRWYMKIKFARCYILRYCAAGFLVQLQQVHKACGGEDVGRTTRQQLLRGSAPIVAARKGRSGKEKAAARKPNQFLRFSAQLFKNAKELRQDR